MAVFRLGTCDPGFRPPSTFLRPFHEANMPTDRFRYEANDDWRGFQDGPPDAVRTLQRHLRQVGFLPHGPLDGVYDYRTRSAARLFQEYVRTVEGRPEIGKADGIVGPNTLGHLTRWLQDGRRADWLEDGITPETPTPAFAAWLTLLETLRAHYQHTPGPILEQVNAFARPTDTRRPDDWDFAPHLLHLIGIRRRANLVPEAGGVRQNNDVFFLLVHGMVFTFFGSTDPNPSMSRTDEPYLVPGQHHYRFGWHKRSSAAKVYRAFRPVRHGVLVLRDTPGGTPDALDDADRLDPAPNDTINIHWSGRETKNWSAGCQVIAGGGYLNHRGDLIDCWEFASPGYVALSRLTRGAYNVFLDLATVFSEDITTSGRLHYTLLPEEDLARTPLPGASAAVDSLKRGLVVMLTHKPDFRNTVARLAPELLD